MGSLKRKVKNLVAGIVMGMEGANQEMFSQNHSIDNGNILNIKEQGGTLSQALKRGEITQEVIDLRYRMYKILDRIDDGKTGVYDGDGNFMNWIEKAVPNNLYKEINDDLILLQNDSTISTTLAESFDTIDKYAKHDGELFKITFNSICRFSVQDYIDKLVLLENGDKTYVDLYITTYPDNINRLKRLLSVEASKLYNKIVHRSDITDIDTIKFTTNNAFGSIDSVEYIVRVLNFVKIVEYDGFYVLRFECDVEIGELPSAKYFSESLEKLYETKAVRKNPLQLTFGAETNRHYRCDVCNKDMNNELEHSDWLITKQETGKGMCLECYAKHLGLELDEII